MGFDDDWGGTWRGFFDSADDRSILAESISSESVDCPVSVFRCDPSEKTAFTGESQGVEAEQFTYGGHLRPDWDRAFGENLPETCAPGNLVGDGFESASRRVVEGVNLNPSVE